MAPNLQVLSLRRLKLTDESFSEIAKGLEVLESLDISDCPFIGKNGVLMFLERCGESLRSLQASSCYDAIDDEVVTQLANPGPVDDEMKPDPAGKVPSRQLEFLDISYCKQVTDEGLKAFDGKKFNITHLCLNGLSLVSGQGLYYPI